jgi:hypothetical protein
VLERGNKRLVAQACSIALQPQKAAKQRWLHARMQLAAPGFATSDVQRAL